VEIQRALAAGPVASGLTVRARIGLHTGQAATTAEGYVGLDVHRAARIGSAAHGGQILTSSTVQGLLLDVASRHKWELRDMGSFALKGLSRLERLFQLDAPGLDRDFPPPRARRPAPVRLPPQLTSLVGRDRKIDEVASLFGVHGARLVTLTGAGGVGKTRLALAVAERVAADYPDGVFFVDLAEQRDPDGVLLKVAEAVGVPIAGPALESLSQTLTHQRVLLVLDNFDRVVAGAPDVTQLLAACPGLHALVTSRVVLRVRSEYEFRVEPLRTPAGDTSDLPLVAGSAAVRLFEQLDRSFDALGRGPIDIPERQQTLRSAIDWSHDLLTDEERATFGRLTVFASPWSLDAARQICGGIAADVVGIVESLVDKSLVRADADAAGVPRFRMLGTIRVYGAERLRESGDEAKVQQAHATYFLDVAERYGRWLTTDRHEAAMRALDVEWDDLRAATNWFARQPDLGKVSRLLQGVWIHIWLRGHVDEVARMDLRPEAAAILPPPDQARLLCVIANVALVQGDYARARELLDRSIDVAGTTGDDVILPWARFTRAITLTAFGVDAATVTDELTQALRWHRSVGEEFWAGWAHLFLGIQDLRLGAIDDALDHHRRFLSVCSRLNVQAMIAQAHTQLGITHLAGGDTAMARRELAIAVDLYRSLVYWDGLALCLDALAGLALDEGDANRAMIAVGAAEAIRTRLGVRPWPPIQSFVDSVHHAADAIDTPDASESRTAGRLMEPLSAAAIALQATPQHQHAI
jgi:predicted ATPase